LVNTLEGVEIGLHESEEPANPFAPVGIELGAYEKSTENWQESNQHKCTQYIVERIGDVNLYFRVVEAHVFV
jgi:hypothetical protein